jgi:hypothetical protein
MSKRRQFLMSVPILGLAWTGSRRVWAADGLAPGWHGLGPDAPPAALSGAAVASTASTRSVGSDPPTRQGAAAASPAEVSSPALSAVRCR